MHSSLHKVLYGPHSALVASMLHDCGWREGDKKEWSRIRGWGSALYGAQQEDAYAQTFMSMYAFVKLYVLLPGETHQDWGERKVEMDPILLLRFLDRALLDRLGEVAGERVFPVGNWNLSDILLLGDKGRFFMTQPGDERLYLLGEGWDGLVHHLQTGDKMKVESNA